MSHPRRPVIGTPAVPTTARWGFWDQAAHLVADTYINSVAVRWVPAGPSRGGADDPALLASASRSGTRRPTARSPSSTRRIARPGHLPTFADLELKAITPEIVAHWHDTAAIDRPPDHAHVYSLLRAIIRTAADPTKNSGRALVPFNPCGISGGGSSGTNRRVRPATAQEVAAIVAALPERRRWMVMLADGCAFRFGEIAELRRSDIDLPEGIIRVRRSVIRSRSAGVVAKAPRARLGSATYRLNSPSTRLARSLNGSSMEVSTPQSSPWVMRSTTL